MADTPVDTGQVENLYRAHHGWLQGWLRRRLDNAWNAADLAQDTFVQVLRRPEEVSGLREPRSYLATIARRLAIDLYRRQSLEQAYLEALASLPEDQVPCLEQQAILLEELLEIDRLLDGLGRSVKHVFLLSRFEGLTYAQIAERTGLSLRTVNSYMAKAMLHCCQLLP